MRGRFELAGREEAPEPEILIEIIDPSGAARPLATDKSGEFELDPGLLGKGHSVSIGPKRREAARRTFSFDSLYRQLTGDPVYRIPKPVWDGWFLPLTCVTGHVSRCFQWPFLGEPGPLQFLRARLTGAANVFGGSELEPGLVPFPRWCSTVCQGRVEVYLRTCCCPPFPPPPVVIKNICEIIDCDFLQWPPPHIGPWPDPWPGPGPRPGPGPDPGPMVEQIALRAVQSAQARPGGPSAERVVELAQHLVALKTMPAPEQIAYIKARPDLIALCCHCTTHKVAEVPIQADGEFDACFWAGPTPFNCDHRILYRVQQLQNGAWVTIYDGLAANQSFDPGEAAELRAGWHAQVCGDPPPPVVSGPEPFVLLEAVGGTWANTFIHSTDQTGELTWGALAATDGLVDAAGAQRPWATGLSLRYHFSDGLAAAPVNAVYYRTRVIPLSGGGNPLTITEGLSWLHYHVTPAFDIDIISETLGPFTVGGVTALYKIPYHRPLEDWLGGQFHANIATADGSMPNGQYLFVVDVFDGTGKRLVPAGAPAAGAGEIGNVAFRFRRMRHVNTTPIPTDVVSQKALASLFLVDNTPCQGLITGLTQGSTFNLDNCQSLGETHGDGLKIRYYAYQSEHYQESHDLVIKKGLFGPWWDVESGTNDIYPADNHDSNQMSILTLLGGETQCSYSATLSVYAKQWNGWSRVQSYDKYDTGAFALSNP